MIRRVVSPDEARESVAGTSTGANIVAAIDVARCLGPDVTVVTVLCDSGLKYLSAPLYREAAAS